MPVPARYYDEICALFSSVRDKKEADKLLQDLLTPQEIDSICERWQLIQELSKGTPQRTIAEKLNISISKITRGSRVMQYGAGGFGIFLKRLKLGKK